MTGKTLASAGNRVEELTGLRFFAALLVFLSHLRWEQVSPALYAFFQQGYVGVSFFFTLSGFVMAHSYSGRITGGTMNFRTFLLLRIARLWPLHIAVALPFILNKLHLGAEYLPKILANVFLLQSWFPNSDFYFALNSPSWSLSNEMFFYISFFAITVWLSPRHVVTVTLLLFATVCATAVVSLVIQADTIVFGGTPWPHWMFYINPAFRILEFLCGMLIHRAYMSGVRIGGNPLLLSLLSFALLFAAMAYADAIPLGFRYSLYYLPFVSFLLIAHIDNGGPSGKLLASPLLVTLGNASFAFYLIHQFLIKRIYGFTGTEMNDFVFAALACGIISVVSVAIYHLYEHPIEKLAKRLLKYRSSSRPPEQPPLPDTSAENGRSRS